MRIEKEDRTAPYFFLLELHRQAIAKSNVSKKKTGRGRVYYIEDMIVSFIQRLIGNTGFL